MRTVSAVDPILLELPEALDGPRVRLRPYRPADATAYWAAVEESRAHLGGWLPWVSRFRAEADARAYVAEVAARWLLREDLTAGVFERASGRLLGGAGLHRIDWELRSFDVGYWLRASAEGRGYMREALALLTRLAFEVLGANRVQVRMDVANARSRAVAEACGFAWEGTLRNCYLGPAGRPVDQHVLALVPAAYRALARAGDRAADPAPR